jgi:anti-sigma regulatory factor (Ser/Thr protein kinase)
MAIRKLTVFVASPGDTTGERDCLAGVVEELNRGVAADHGYVLELVKWETHAWPGLGVDAQDVINREIKLPDVLIVILWTRIGTRTGRAQSGTIEEFERAYEALKSGQSLELLVYFKQTPYYPKKQDLDQIREVLEFRDRVQKLGILAWDFLSADDFRDTVREHLAQVIRHRTIDLSDGPADSGNVSVTSSRLQMEHESLVQGHLETLIDARDPTTVTRFMGMLGGALPDRGFRQESVRAVQTAAWELLSNVARHGNNRSLPTIRVNIPPASPKWLEIEVDDMGSGFDLNEAIVAAADDVHNGRHHGLWRVKRLASDMDVRQLSSGRYRVRCVFCEALRPPSVFDDVKSKALIMVEWEWPRIFWIENTSYVNRGIIHDLAGCGKSSLREGSQVYFRVLNLSFCPPEPT